MFDSPWRTLGAAVLAGLLVVSGSAAHGAESWRERFTDPADGAFDASEYLLSHRGVLPVPIIVTEPAVGFGGGLAALWFRESLGDARARGEAEWGRITPPTIAGVAGFGTENGSWGAAGVYFAPFAGDRYRYLGALAKVGLELDYYSAAGRRVGYSLAGDALIQQLLARIGESDWFVGGRYVYFGAESRFDFSLPIEIPRRELDTRIGRLSLIVNHDSRDNILRPAAGPTWRPS